MEFQRNRERYQFLKWGMQAFDTFKVVPPGIGIVHQVNLEYLAKGVLSQPAGATATVYYPDTLVGTDSHTTMINGLGIVGWGVGGIEAEAGMLGQPVYFLTPDVVGVYFTGALTRRRHRHRSRADRDRNAAKGQGRGQICRVLRPRRGGPAVVDRATIANMAPEYGATMGFFPIDEECVDYLRQTGRAEEHCRLYENYFRAQGLFGIPEKRRHHLLTDLELDIAAVTPSVAGPKRPQDRIELGSSKGNSSRPWQAGHGKWFWQNAGDWKDVCSIDRRAMTASGGSQEPVSTEQSKARNTNPFTELEMANNRPTPDPTTARPAPTATASRRRVDCRHHQLHQHQQSLRDAGRRFAREKSGRKRPASPIRWSRPPWPPARASSPII